MGEDRLLDKMTKAYHDTPRQSVTLDVGGEEITLYWTPLTVADTKAVQRLEPATEFDHNLYMICRKITDEKGERLFRDGDKKRLETEVKLETLAEINRAMNADIPATVEEAREVLEKNPD